MSPPSQRTRLLIVDDDAMVRVGLKSVLGNEPTLDVVGEADNSSEALALASQLLPDVMLVDIRMQKQSNGLSLTRQVVARHPTIRILILTMQHGQEFVREAKAAGASGYVLKNDAAAHLFDAIRVVTLGGQYFRELDAADGTARPTTSRSPLTPREREALILIADGLRSLEVAERMGIGIRTVDTYRQSIREKTGIDTPAEFVTYAQDHGLLSR